MLVYYGVLWGSNGLDAATLPPCQYWPNNLLYVQTDQCTGIVDIRISSETVITMMRDLILGEDALLYIVYVFCFFHLYVLPVTLCSA